MKEIVSKYLIRNTFRIPVDNQMYLSENRNVIPNKIKPKYKRKK